MPDESFYKVKINTWGTKDKPSNGLDNIIDQGLFGGNVGHASIEMALPPTEETQRMIETYCMEQTFEDWKDEDPRKRKYAQFDQYIREAKQRIPVRSMDSKQTESFYYKIDFSFWPSMDDAPFDLSTIEEDMENERYGHHFEYSDAAREYLQPEERIHRGVIGARVMTYAPMAIAHQRDMDDKAFKKIGLAMELEKVTEALEAEKLLGEKANALTKPKIDGSLSKICQNMGLNIELLAKKYVDDELSKGKQVDVKQFKEFILATIAVHIEDLKTKQKKLKKEIKDIDTYLDQQSYVTRGVPPDHTQELPYRTGNGRGLDPEAMLKKMKELTDPGAQPFDLNTKNCSKTSIAVLRAGADHDPLLARALGEEALGAIGTPQQVIGNAKRASDIIVHDRQNTLFTRIANSDVLNRAMGRFIAAYQTDDITIAQKAKAIVGIMGIGLLKTPEILIRALINPSDTITDITSAVRTVFNHANSLPLKVIVGVLSVIPMLALAPFAILEKGMEALQAQFKALANWVTKDPPTAKNAIDADITEKDARVAKTINQHRQEAVSKTRTPLGILSQFERDLKDTQKVVTLSARDFSTLNKYVREKNDPETSRRFQACCTDSLKRANQLSLSTGVSSTPTELFKQGAGVAALDGLSKQGNVESETPVANHEERASFDY